MSKEKSLLFSIKDLENEIKKNLLKEESKNNDSYHLSGTQHRIMKYLINHKDEEVCQNILEKELNLTRSTISGVLQTMEKHQIIERKKSKQDTRTKIISLSSKSEERYLEGKNKLARLEKKARKNLTQAEINEFLTIINKIKESIND